MIAKLIAHARRRAEAAATRSALACARGRGLAGEDQRRLPGALLSEPDFVAGEVDTGFIDARLDALTAEARPSRPTRSLALAGTRSRRRTDGDAVDRRGALAGFRLDAPAATD